jgi:hypothetical protein
MVLKINIQRIINSQDLSNPCPREPEHQEGQPVPAAYSLEKRGRGAMIPNFKGLHEFVQLKAVEALDGRLGI